MSIRTALAPYKAAALGVVMVGLLLGGIAIGKVWEERGCIAAQAVSSIVSTEEAAELAALRLANAEYAETAKRALEDVEANKRLASQYINEADAAADRAKNLERQLILKEKEWKRQFADAMNDPKCAELLALEVCPLVPMP